jgi:hypothetical protein
LNRLQDANGPAFVLKRAGPFAFRDEASMSIRGAAGILWLLSLFFLAGCGGGNDSANLNKDLPIRPKKEKDPEKKNVD